MIKGQVIITGASGGLGNGLISELRQRGNNNIIGLYNKKKPTVNGVDLIQCDLAEDEIPDELLNKVSDNVNIIHLAGVSISSAFKKINMEDIKKQYELNTIGGLKLIHSLWPKMKEAQYGRFIFISSVVAHLSVFGTIGYAMSKVALETAAKGLLAEGAKDNILPFCIALGYTDKGMISQVPDDIQEIMKKQIPLKRFGTAEELANTIEFLINTPYMAGQTVHLNGGLYL